MLEHLSQINILLAQERRDIIALTQENERLRKEYTKLLEENERLSKQLAERSSEQSGVSD